MYALQQAMRAIRTNWVASVATITTTTLSLTILAGFSLVSLNLNQVLRDLQSELEVSAFLAPGARKADTSSSDCRSRSTWFRFRLTRLNPARIVSERVMVVIVATEATQLVRTARIACRSAYTTAFYRVPTGTW